MAGTVLSSFRLPRMVEGGTMDSLLSLEPSDVSWRLGLLTAQTALTLVRALLAVDSLRLPTLQDLTATSASTRQVLIVTGARPRVKG